MAGAAAFTHVHDLTVAHGQPDWIGWANAVAVELMAIYLGLEIRARRRTGRLPRRGRTRGPVGPGDRPRRGHPRGRGSHRR
ncbi:hypothetical protein [Micromonospora sp. NPDC005220]|uniref:hypothetical protein n=1 Tax=Micromonospora sp. NPDC005220 TaxID=3155589 RepID=UPI0033BD1BFA